MPIIDINTLTTSLSLTALIVGGVIIGKQYYKHIMYNNIINLMMTETNRKIKNCFLIDRLIDPNCNGMEVYIGVNGNVNPNNILSNQGIRIGKYGEIKHLTSFIKVENGLLYTFEDNIKLTITKNDNNEIMYSLKAYDDMNVTKLMNPRMIKLFKSIGMSSNELDKINDFIKTSKQMQEQEQEQGQEQEQSKQELK
jgi:hypothetical protein